MSLSQFISNNTFLISFILIVGFITWKFIIQPIQNEGKPIEPTEEDIERYEDPLGLKNVAENINFDCDI